MIKQKVKRRGDTVSAMDGKAYLALFVLIALIASIFGMFIYDYFKSPDEDDAGAKVTTDTGVNVTAEEVNKLDGTSPWALQNANVAINNQETVNDWMKTQEQPGESPLIEPSVCNSLLGATPMFSGQADSVMISMMNNSDFAPDSVPSPGNTPDSQEAQKSGVSLIQSTMSYADSVSGKLGIETIQKNIEQCVNDSSISESAKKLLPEKFDGEIDYSFKKNDVKSLGANGASYEVSAWAEKDGKRTPIIYINVGTYYSETHNAGTVVFVRSDVEGYDNGSKDIEAILPEAAKKLELVGMELGEKEADK